MRTYTRSGRLIPKHEQQRREAAFNLSNPKWTGTTERLARLLNQVRLLAAASFTAEECWAMQNEGWIYVQSNGWWGITAKGREALLVAEHPYQHTSTD